MNPGAVADGDGDLDVVIVNWNAGGHLAACLHSVYECTAPVRLGRVVVVDNASTDDSLDRAAAELDRPASVLVRNESNAGFAAACNQGARRGNAPLILFLNPDTRLLDSAVPRVVEFLGGPGARVVGICGGDVVDETGRPNVSGGPFPTVRLLLGQVTGLWRVLPSVFPPKHVMRRVPSGPMDHVIGAFLVARREMFEALGGFDERYFLYYEEVDLCLRARRHGWLTYHVAGAEVVHVGQVSSSQIGGMRLAFSLTSRRLFARAHWPRPARALLAVVTLAVELPARLLSEAVRTRGFPADTVRGYVGHARSLRRPRPAPATREDS